MGTKTEEKGNNYVSEIVMIILVWFGLSVLVYVLNILGHFGLKIWNCIGIGAILGLICLAAQSIFKDFITTKHKIWFAILAALYVIYKLVVYSVHNWWH